MAGPAGNSEFCFPSTYMLVPRGFASNNIEGLRETKLCFPWVQLLSAYYPRDFVSSKVHILKCCA